jgi:hypothetical protein
MSLIAAKIGPHLASPALVILSNKNFVQKVVTCAEDINFTLKKYFKH